MLQQEAIPFPQETVYNDWLTVLPWFEAELTPHLLTLASMPRVHLLST